MLQLFFVILNPLINMNSWKQNIALLWANKYIWSHAPVNHLKWSTRGVEVWLETVFQVRGCIETVIRVCNHVYLFLISSFFRQTLIFVDLLTLNQELFVPSNSCFGNYWNAMFGSDKYIAKISHLLSLSESFLCGIELALRLIIFFISLFAKWTEK